MTLRTFHARLMACYALRIQEGQELSRALAMGAGRLFSEKGSKELDDALADALATIRGQAASILSGKPITEEALEQAGAAARAQARAKALSPEEQEKNTARLIRKLDASMSMLTGRLIRNPALDGPGAVGPFDLKNSSLADVLSRVDGAKS